MHTRNTRRSCWPHLSSLFCSCEAPAGERYSPKVCNNPLFTLVTCHLRRQIGQRRSGQSILTEQIAKSLDITVEQFARAVAGYLYGARQCTQNVRVISRLITIYASAISFYAAIDSTQTNAACFDECDRNRKAYMTHRGRHAPGSAVEG